MLKETPLYAILSGFSFGDTPGVGTFYDFFSRIWQHDSNNLSPKDRFPKMKPPKGKKKGEKTPCDSSRLLPLLERWHLKPENPFFLIFRLYQQQFLGPSIHKGLIAPRIWLLQGMAFLSALPHSNAKNGSVTVRKKDVPPVTANAIIPNRTATGDGTPTGNVISSVTTSTCMWLPIPTVTSLYSLF